MTDQQQSPPLWAAARDRAAPSPASWPSLPEDV